MTEIHGFEKVDVRDIPELKTKADLCRHAKTGYQLLLLVNNDENKVFGINLRTPASDCTRVAHILGHLILCGSRKFPVKDSLYHIDNSTSQFPVLPRMRWLR